MPVDLQCKVCFWSYLRGVEGERGEEVEKYEIFQVNSEMWTAGRAVVMVWSELSSDGRQP